MNKDMSSLKLSKVIAPPAGTVVSGGPIISAPQSAAFFGNESGNSSATGTAGTQSPIIGYGATTTSGDATLLATFNKSNATFTAPFNGQFSFVGWQQWLNGGTSASYQLNFTTNAAYSNMFISNNYVAITPFNYQVALTSGQTVQITGNSSTSWGTFKNSLTIYGTKTL